MKYRLKKEGEDSLLWYIKRRMPINRLADRVGMSRQGLTNLLEGNSKRPLLENLESIARELDLKLEFDGEYAFSSEKQAEIDPEALEFYERLKDMPSAAEIVKLL